MVERLYFYEVDVCECEQELGPRFTDFVRELWFLGGKLCGLVITKRTQMVISLITLCRLSKMMSV